MTSDAQARAANWIQFGLLLIAILMLAVQVEGRLSRVEQKLDDSEKDRQQVQEQLNRMETEIASWHSTLKQFQVTQ